MRNQSWKLRQEKLEWDFLNYKNIQALEEFSRGEVGTRLTGT